MTSFCMYVTNLKNSRPFVFFTPSTCLPPPSNRCTHETAAPARNRCTCETAAPTKPVYLRNRCTTNAQNNTNAQDNTQNLERFKKNETNQSISFFLSFASHFELPSFFVCSQHGMPSSPPPPPFPPVWEGCGQQPMVLPIPAVLRQLHRPLRGGQRGAHMPRGACRR